MKGFCENPQAGDDGYGKVTLVHIPGGATIERWPVDARDIVGAPTGDGSVWFYQSTGDPTPGDLPLASALGAAASPSPVPAGNEWPLT